MIKGRHLALYQIFKTTVFTTKYMININNNNFLIYIYILRQSINGDDYLSGAAQREQTKKNYKKGADHINSDKIKLYTKFIYGLKFVV
jgi:hypothetical protein